MKRLIATTVLGLVMAGCAAAVAEIPAADVPQAFIDITQAHGRTMHMVWHGTSTMAQRAEATTQFTGTFDFAGEDYAGTISLDGPVAPDGGGKLFDVELALVGGRAFQRSTMSGIGNWEEASLPGGTLDPLHGLEVGDVSYVGAEAIDGADLHHLRVTEVAALAGFMQTGFAGFGGNPVAFDSANSSFDIYVDATGHPVSATVRLATSADADEFGTISLDSTYEFSNWNAEIYIVSPL